MTIWSGEIRELNKLCNSFKGQLPDIAKKDGSTDPNKSEEKVLRLFRLVYLLWNGKITHMKKVAIYIILCYVLFLSGCKQNTDQTEIKVQLSEAEYFWVEDYYARDSLYLTAYNYAVENYNPETEDFLSILSIKLSEIDPEARLAKYFLSVERMYTLNFESTNQEVLNLMEEEVNLAKEESILVLARRIKLFCKPSSALAGLFDKTVVTVTKLPEKNNWLFTVNRKVDSAQLTKLLQSYLVCGFWETYELSEIMEYLSAANYNLQDSSVAQYLSIEPDSAKRFRDDPLFSILSPSLTPDGESFRGSIMGSSNIHDTALVIEYLSIPFIRNLFPRDLKFMWAVNPSGDNMEYLNLFAIKITSRDGFPKIDERLITEVVAVHKDKLPAIKLKFDAEGAKKWSILTRENIGRQIIFSINNNVYATTQIKEEITNGTFIISGDFTAEGVNELTSLLGAGPIPKIGLKVIDVN